MKRTYSRKRWQVKHPVLPILFIGGKDDPCIGSKKQFSNAMDSLRKVGYKNVQGNLFGTVAMRSSTKTKWKRFIRSFWIF
jgi:hypothetical protein